MKERGLQWVFQKIFSAPLVFVKTLILFDPAIWFGKRIKERDKRAAKALPPPLQSNKQATLRLVNTAHDQGHVLWLAWLARKGPRAATIRLRDQNQIVEGVRVFWCVCMYASQSVCKREKEDSNRNDRALTSLRITFILVRDCLKSRMQINILFISL